MKIAIHHRERSFSERWISFCKKQNISFKIVNCFDNDIVKQVKDCDGLMRHHHHADYKDTIAAKKILFSLEHAGIPVFPDFNTCWHFDDKVAQKYLLEAIGAPLVPSYVFYDKKSALEWANNTTFPKVFKLSGGAGAANVSLSKTKREAIQKINTAFGKGFSQYDKLSSLKDRYQKYREGQTGIFDVFKGLGRFLIPTEYAKMQGREKGYVYFQEFMAKNDFDIRVIVIGERAFAVKRLTRENDFRASGSGRKKYEKEEIDIECVKIAFAVNKKIKTQSIGYDFVYDENNNPLLIEIGYGFAIDFYDPCPGFWDNSLNWHEENFNPQEWMVENLIKSVEKESNERE